MASDKEITIVHYTRENQRSPEKLENDAITVEYVTGGARLPVRYVPQVTPSVQRAMKDKLTKVDIGELYWALVGGATIMIGLWVVVWVTIHLVH